MEHKSAIKVYGSSCFGRAGMSCKRFDVLFTSAGRTHQSIKKPDGMIRNSERYRWLLVDGFVNRFNEHRARPFVPSYTIGVDESISRWYGQGQGGKWISHGLPMYVVIDRKPENGCKIQSSACGVSSIMIWLSEAREDRKRTDSNQWRQCNKQRRWEQWRITRHKILKESIYHWYYSVLFVQVTTLQVSGNGFSCSIEDAIYRRCDDCDSDVSDAVPSQSRWVGTTRGP